jgi:hypothetical protein
MKRKTFKYIVLALFLACFLFFLIVIVPKLGRPNREVVNFFRTTHLNDWRKATINYTQQNDDFPESLFEVYVYNDKIKSVTYLSFFTWACIEVEDSLIKNKKILEDKAFFNKTIAYELVRDGETWFIREKREDPPLLDKYKFLKVDEDEMLKIDQDGNITLVTPKAEK